MKQNENEERNDEGRGERRAYQSPALVEYGSVAKLTQGTLTVGADGPGGGMKNSMCL
jgi:hypothetical protein